MVNVLSLTNTRPLDKVSLDNKGGVLVWFSYHEELFLLNGEYEFSLPIIKEKNELKMQEEQPKCV